MSSMFVFDLHTDTHIQKKKKAYRYLINIHLDFSLCFMTGKRPFTYHKTWNTPKLWQNYSNVYSTLQHLKTCDQIKHFGLFFNNCAKGTRENSQYPNKNRPLSLRTECILTYCRTGIQDRHEQSHSFTPQAAYCCSKLYVLSSSRYKEPLKLVKKVNRIEDYNIQHWLSKTFACHSLVVVAWSNYRC